jgi:dTDP-4-amino-4,6-dideoxygalactose transaminase
MADRPSKHEVADLAVCGGPAAFTEPVHVGRPNIPDPEAFLARTRDILERRWLTNNGYYVQELERQLCERLHVRHCIPVCNGTIGLELAIRAAGLTGEVIVPSFTFIATPHALTWQGITPIFCDVDPVSQLLSLESVERAITPRTSGILAVHLWGQPCFPEDLTALAERHHLHLLFDAAHALDCSHGGTMIGNFGTAEIFSFHATKFFHTFEGGAVATNDDAFARSIRLAQNFGFDGYDNALLVGTNGKMSEVCAAMGVTGLESLDSFANVNRAHYNLYLKQLQGLPGVRMLQFDAGERQNYQYIVLDIDPVECPLSRDQLQQVLWLENVRARRYFYPGCHRMPAYNRHDLLLPGTDRASAGVLVLPNGTAVTADDIVAICGIISIALLNAAEVKPALAKRLEEGTA